MFNLDCTAMGMDSAAFGRVTIERHMGNVLKVTIEGRQRFFAFPEVIADGYFVPDDPEFISECRKLRDFREWLNQVNCRGVA